MVIVLIEAKGNQRQRPTERDSLVMVKRGSQTSA